MLRAAVVGAGPSGLYAAESLLALPGFELRVDVIERLPVPLGLVSYGVAPDHPKIKSLATPLGQILEDARVTFLGGVTVGEHLSRAELVAQYDAVVYAVGARGTRPLGVEGESLPGSVSATDVVSWYNGHPDHPQPPSLDTDTVLVVGGGNVALDVARMLVRPPGELRETDMPLVALQALDRSSVRHARILVRRGPAGARFSPKELRELTRLQGVQVIVRADPASLEPGPDADRNTRSMLDLLRGWARPDDAEPSWVDLQRTITLEFNARPVRVLGTARVTGAAVERTEDGPDGRTVGTGEVRELRCGLVVASTGNVPEPLQDLPWDPVRGTVRHHAGRIAAPSADGRAGEYAVGWFKRGASGVVGSNKLDANETAATAAADLVKQVGPRGGRAGVATLLRSRGVRSVDLGGWRAIDLAERAQGELEGRVRSKIANAAELFEIGTTGLRLSDEVAS